MSTKDKKGQVQMGEAVTIVIIVILLIVFGFVFYTKWAEANLRMKAASFREMDAYAVATVAANLPELHCSKNNIVELNCYDMLKIKAMARTINESRYGYFEYRSGSSSIHEPVSKDSFFFYSSLFKNARIAVYEIYPSNPALNVNYSDTPFYYVVYDNAPLQIHASIPARIPIVLYDPLQDRNSFGIIEVVRYY